MIESLAPSGYMRYSPDGEYLVVVSTWDGYLNFSIGHFVFASFASAFLLKVCFTLLFVA